MNPGDPTGELRSWLASNWDPDLTVADWWERLGLAGWSSPALPVNAYGRGQSADDAVRTEAAISRFGALPPPSGLGIVLAAPTIAQYGTPSQIDRFVRPIVTGQQFWCQLFSEPGAGSDLAGVRTRAERDGDEWVISGQKVWTSGGQNADMGMLLARTDPVAPKHRGLTWFALDMQQRGRVDVRPLGEMTGRSVFNEVFLNEARVHDSSRVGDLNDGWAVANATLGFERMSIGSGGRRAAASVAVPGALAGDLGKRAGDFVGLDVSGDMATLELMSDAARVLVGLARDQGLQGDPVLRQQLMRLHSTLTIAAYATLRAKAAQLAGKPQTPGLGNIAKLAMSSVARTSRDIGLQILGARGMLHGYTEQDWDRIEAILDDPLHRPLTELALFSPAPAIYGGTDEIQRNILAERILGLPKEPS